MYRLPQAVDDSAHLTPGLFELQVVRPGVPLGKFQTRDG